MIKNLPQEERPRERLLKQGSEALSVVELLALLLGSGTRGKSVLTLSQEVLIHFGSLQGIAEATVTELSQIQGIGRVKAIQLKAALHLASRLVRFQEKQSFPITTPFQAYTLVKEFYEGEKRELFGVLLQNAKGKMIRWEVVSIGTLTQTLVHPREVFYPAIRHQAVSVILFHNHPSGDLSPSREDIQVTENLIAAGQMMNIPVQDHLIVSERGYFSFREKGLLNN